MLLCGRYFFDLASNELKKYHDQAETKAADKDIRLATNEVFPSNHVVTLGLKKEAEVIPGIIRWGFEGIKKGQLMINARSETVKEKKYSRKLLENPAVFFQRLVFMNGITTSKNFYSKERRTVLYLLVAFIASIELNQDLKQNQLY